MATDLVASREILRERFQDLKGVLTKVVERVVTTDPTHIRDYVDKLKRENPHLSKDDLAKLVVSRKALKNGCVGAFGSLGGAFCRWRYLQNGSRLGGFKPIWLWPLHTFTSTH